MIKPAEETMRMGDEVRSMREDANAHRFNAIIVPIHKNGDILECQNYREVTLLCTIYKVLYLVIKKIDDEKSWASIKVDSLLKGLLLTTYSQSGTR